MIKQTVLEYLRHRADFHALSSKYKKPIKAVMLQNHPQQMVGGVSGFKGPFGEGKGATEREVLDLCISDFNHQIPCKFSD